MNKKTSMFEQKKHWIIIWADFKSVVVFGINCLKICFFLKNLSFHQSKSHTNRCVSFPLIFSTKNCTKVTNVSQVIPNSRYQLHNISLPQIVSHFFRIIIVRMNLKRVNGKYSSWTLKAAEFLNKYLRSAELRDLLHTIRALRFHPRKYGIGIKSYPVCSFRIVAFAWRS